MAVYLFTFHAYRSWMPDRRRGYVRDGDEGILEPDEKMAEWYARDARSAPVEFDAAMAEAMIDAAREVCCEHQVRLHQIRITSTHVHLLVSWDEFEDWKSISTPLKRRLGSATSKCLDRPGPWFSRGCSRKRVRDRSHYRHLMDQYLPDHGGWYWREDET